MPRGLDLVRVNKVRQRRIRWCLGTNQRFSSVRCAQEYVRNTSFCFAKAGQISLLDAVLENDLHLFSNQSNSLAQDHSWKWEEAIRSAAVYKSPSGILTGEKLCLPLVVCVAESSTSSAVITPCLRCVGTFSTFFFPHENQVCREVIWFHCMCSATSVGYKMLWQVPVDICLCVWGGLVCLQSHTHTRADGEEALRELNCVHCQAM